MALSLTQPRLFAARIGLVTLGLMAAGPVKCALAAGGGVASDGMVWEGERFEIRAADESGPASAGIPPEVKADWLETIRLLTLLPEGGPGARETLIDALLEPTPAQRLVMHEQYRRALLLLPLLRNASPAFADARVALLELRDVIAEYRRNEATLQALRDRHRTVTARDTYGHDLGRLLNLILEGSGLGGETSPDFRDRARRPQELYRRQGLPALLRLRPAEIAAGAFKTRDADLGASPYYFLTRYHETLGLLPRDQAERVFTKEELASYLLFGETLKRTKEIELRVAEIRGRLCLHLDALFRKRRFSEFIVAYRCMQALLPPSLLAVTTADTEMGPGFVESFVRREGLVRLIPAHTARLHRLAEKYDAAGKRDAADAAREEARRLDEHLWHTPL